MAGYLEYITLVTRNSTFYFSEATNNGLNILDQADLRNQILPWQADVWYYHKWLMADDCTIMCHTRTNPAQAPRLYVCKRQVDVNGLPTVVTSIDLNTAPRYKGTQTFPGNTYTDPDTGATTDLDTSLWVFSFSTFSAYLSTNEIYYLRLDAYNDTSPYSYYSEPIYLRADKHPNTQLYQSSYRANRRGNTNVIITGWYDNYPANTVSFVPTFTTRCESYVLPLDPKAVNVGYLNQSYQQLQITTQQLPMRTLKIGELCTGVPDYMLQMITEFLLADSVKIGGYSYILSGQASQTSPADMWKSKRDENSPLLRAATVLTIKTLSQQAMRRIMQSPCVCPPPVNAYVTASGPSYYGNFTFQFPDGFTCPFVIDVSTHYSSASFTLYSLDSFTTHSGDNYTLTFLIGGYPDLHYSIRLLSAGTVCTTGDITYTCSAPVISGVSIVPNGSGGYMLHVSYSSCGADCHVVHVDYQQTSPATTDNGIYAENVSCNTPISYDHALSPGGSLVPGTDISYNVTISDCCGNIQHYTGVKRRI